jgi:hypothetical protein
MLSYDELMDRPVFDVCEHPFGGFATEEKNIAANKILNELIAKFGKPSCGRNRATFRLHSHVFKFPINEYGESDNHWEATHPSDDCAKSRGVTYRNFCCVMAEYIEPVGWKELPEWAQWSDGAGRSRNGSIKIYDFGIF